MAILEPNHPALAGNFKTAYKDLAKETLIILYELDKAIIALTREGLKSFSLNTGQTSHSVTQQDLPILIQRRADLVKQLEHFDEMSGGGVPPAHVQVVPIC
ncbi:hypothetical protein AGMMS50268_18080 [Spirochaetia bacterium]|nr:hypothetical protein AGMMS50268_18080 [Spirochaetia bacterium]